MNKDEFTTVVFPGQCLSKRRDLALTLDYMRERKQFG